VLQCGKLMPESLPGFAQMCDYQFSDPAFPDDNCGSVIKTPGSGYTGEYPMWSSKPRYVNFTVYAPSFVSPSGSCKQVGQSPRNGGFTWMANAVFTAYWVCPDGLSIFPLVYVYYYAPGSDTSGPATCGFGESNLPLGAEYTQFQLPFASVGWGGTLRIVWKMLVSYHNGAFISHMFADKTITFTNGSRNACTDMSYRS